MVMKGGGSARPLDNLLNYDGAILNAELLDFITR